MLATLAGSRRRKIEEAKERAAKRHLPLPRTVQISIACFLHVDDGNVLLSFLFYNYYYYYCYCLFFFLEGETLELYLLLWFRTWGRKMLSSLWRSGQASLTDHSMDELRSAAGCQGRLRDALQERARACSTHRAAANDGTWTFSLYRSPSDPSGCCRQHLGPSPSSPTASRHHDTLEIEFTESHYQCWVTAVCLPVVCVCLHCQCVVKDRSRNGSRSTYFFFSPWGHVKFHIQILISEFKTFSLFSKQSKCQIKT